MLVVFPLALWTTAVVFDIAGIVTGSMLARAVAFYNIGAGIVGNSMAYHLAEQGWRNIVLLDKGPLPSPGGSTGHASNFIFLVDHSKEMTALTADSVREQGVFARIAQTSNRRITIRLTGTDRRFKYVHYFAQQSPARLVLDLYKSRPPTKAAEIVRGRGGCLRLDNHRVTSDRVTADGRELNLFEHSLVVRLRRNGGRIHRQKPETAFMRTWSTDFTYPPATRQTGTLEGVPDIITRGFVMDGSPELLSEGARLLTEVVEQASIEERTDHGLIKEKLRVELRRFLRKRSGRRPFVLPVIMEI